MSTLVVKLGSSIVADESRRGAARRARRALRPGGGAARVGRRDGGGHLRGHRPRDAPDGSADAPARDGGAAGRLGRRPGQALPHLRRAAAGARGEVRPGAADLLRHVGAHPLPQRPPHAAQAARLARGAGDQRERHHHHRRDLLRRQRLPRRPGGDPAGRGRAGAAHRHRRALHQRPEQRPLGRADSRGPRARAARALRHRAVDLAARARAACAPRWWRRIWPPPPGFPW